MITKAYVDQFRHENERSRRDLGIDFSDELGDLVKNSQDNEFDNFKIPTLDSVTVNRNPTSDNEVSKKKYFDDSIRECIIVRFNQLLQNYLKASVQNDICNLTN